MKTRRPKPPRDDEPLDWEREWIDGMLRAALEARLRERRERDQSPERKSA